MKSTLESLYKAVETCGGSLHTTNYLLSSMQEDLNKVSLAYKKTEAYALFQKFLAEVIKQKDYLTALYNIPSTIWSGNASSIDARIPNDLNYQKHLQTTLSEQILPSITLKYNINDDGSFVRAYFTEDGNVLSDTDKIATLDQELQTWLVANHFASIDGKIYDTSIKIDDEHYALVGKDKFITSFMSQDSTGFENFVHADNHLLNIKTEIAQENGAQQEKGSISG